MTLSSGGPSWDALSEDLLRYFLENIPIIVFFGISGQSQQAKTNLVFTNYIFFYVPNIKQNINTHNKLLIIVKTLNYQHLK